MGGGSIRAGIEQDLRLEKQKMERRLAELESFAFYVRDHSNDPEIVANAKRVLGDA